jgi:GGDEF domain-containing protein
MEPLAAMTSVMTTAAFHASASGQIIESNAPFVQLMRCVPGDDWRMSVNNGDRTLIDTFWDSIFEESQTLHQPVAFHVHGDDDVYQIRAQAVMDNDGNVVSAVGIVVVEAMTSKRRWDTDDATGLPEHDAVIERFDELTEGGQLFAAAVILLDPDDANDDLLRKEAARQLLSTVRPTDLIASAADGRFLLCATGVRTPDTALAMAGRKTSAHAQSSITPPIGHVLSEPDAATATLVREAEAGAYASEPGSYGFAP